MSKSECAELSTANFTIMDLANENDSSMCYDTVQNFDTEAIVSPIPEMPQKPLAKKKTSNKREEIQKKVTEMSAGFILFLIHVI